MKKSLKKFIYEKLEKGEYISDQDVFNFMGSNDFSFYTAEQYKDEFRRLEFLKEKFKDFIKDPTVRICKNYRCHILDNHEMREKSMVYKIPKTYFDYLKGKGIKVDK